MKQLFKKGMVLSCIAMAGFHAEAQVYPYFVDFESDSIKAYASATPVVLNGISWTLPGVYLGDMENSDRRNGRHAARVRLTDNTTGNNGNLTMRADLAEGIGTVSFYHAMYGSETGGTLAVFYSTDQGGTWTQAGAAITPGSTLALATIPVNVAGPARISIRKTDGANVRINVDDILVTGYNGYATNVVVTGKTPAGPNVPLSVNALTIQFNEVVSKGAGNIVLHNVTDNTDQTIAVTASDVIVNGQDITVNGISLGSGKEYYVTFDSAAFTNSGASLNSTGIYGTDVWTFTALDTSVPGSITFLNESFGNCADPVYGKFRAFSVSGSQDWHCGTQGRKDNGSVFINGGFSGGANDNEDWLISVAPVDLTGVGNAVLGFWTKLRYSGTTIKQVLVSSDYTGAGDPNAATWQIVKDVTTGISGTNWVEFSGLSLDNYKSSPFYLAFKYVSASANGGAEEWSVDDITIGFPQGVAGYRKNEPGLVVLGPAASSEIVLGVTLQEAEEMTIAVFNMAGKKVCERSGITMFAGYNNHTLSGLNLHPGMYVIRAGGAKHFGVVKAVVQ